MQNFIHQNFALLQELKYVGKPDRCEDIKARSIPFNTNVRQVHDLLVAYERIGGKLVDQEEVRAASAHAQVNSIISSFNGTMQSLFAICKELLLLVVKQIDLKGHVQSSLTNKLLNSDNVQFTKSNLKEIYALNDKIISHYKFVHVKFKIPSEFQGLILVQQLHHLQPLLVTYKDQTILNLYFTYIQTYKDFTNHVVPWLAYPQFVSILSEITSSVKRINSAQSMSLLYMIYWDLLFYIKYFSKRPPDEDTVKMVNLMLNTVILAARSLLDSIQLDIYASGSINEKYKQHMERIKKFFWGKDVQLWVMTWSIKQFSRIKDKSELNLLIDGYFTEAQRTELSNRLK
eukprot:NODE_5_length_49639_cov_0.484336.p11 type:complete len:345 gc:universal NODE_5_length_49639_cov_0.484336:46944-45910(-)